MFHNFMTTGVFTTFYLLFHIILVLYIYISYFIWYSVLFSASSSYSYLYIYSNFSRNFSSKFESLEIEYCRNSLKYKIFKLCHIVTSAVSFILRVTFSFFPYFWIFRITRKGKKGSFFIDQSTS